jgi:CRISPR/Cas system-associated exonuclease Cas4 (RecB family)
MQHYYQAMGKLSEEDTERRFTDEEHGIKGKTDGIVELADRRWILELKSMRSGRFKSLRQPPQPDLEQGMLYCHEFECSGVIFQYENKDDQDIKEFLVERNETVVQRMLDKADRIWACLRAQRLPPRDCRTSSEGRFCPYQAICFNDFFDLGGYWNGIRNSRRAAGSGV